MYEKLKKLAILLVPKKLLERYEGFFRKLISYKYRGQKYCCNICDFNLKDFAGSAKFLEEVESEGHILDESQIFILGISLYNINRISDSCDRLFESQRLGYEEATNAVNILCSNFLK